MKKIIAVALSLLMILGMVACKDGTKTPEVKEESLTSKLDIENISDEAAMIGHVSCYDGTGKLVWSYDTDKVYVSQLDNLQEIGFTSYGYLLLVDGNVICLAKDGENAGKELWRNGLFGGASASWDFDENENLYICGYFGPELAVINPNGEMNALYHEAFAEDFYWPYKLDYEKGFVYISYEVNDLTIKIDPTTGTVEDIELKDQSDLANMLHGTWVDNIDDPYIYFGFDSDGTLIAFRDADEECYAYGGTWSCDESSFSLALDKTDDPLLNGASGLGDYEIKKLGTNNGVVAMDMVQINNGESLFSISTNNFKPTMYKISSDVSYDNPAGIEYENIQLISDAVGTWVLSEAEIEGWNFDPAKEGMSGTMYIDANGVCEFSFVNPNASDTVFKNMKPVILRETLYGSEAEPGESPWCIKYDGDKMNWFKAGVTDYDVLEVLWYQGEWTADSYPAVLWMRFDKTSY